ncbi:unnamed protein product [Caenorhabditis bovis]|uniref:G-protein coupled receptors family 1 profile domain-containing protein n=1 Tax=Caenorhabditis bovis TaxID=2654633 RepID=A0A8S1EDG2_9PELO|nr:unnamed protein product [Caenorhabditis bovis]
MNSSTNSSATNDDMNTTISTDYIQLLLYTIFMIVGLPVNISTLIYMLKRYRHAKSFLLLLHINLNVSDILVLGLYVPGLAGWLITWEWKGGNVMCKFMRFVDAFVLAISSNIMVCIALYRLSALRYPLWVNAVGHSRVPRMLVAAWLIAILTMLPQVFVWHEAEFLNGIRQCVTIWSEQLINGINLTDNEMIDMKFYMLQNTTIIFYIPLLILIICYVLILKDIYKTLNTDTECSSAMYFSEMSRNSSSKGTCKTGRKEIESNATVLNRTMRGQEKFRRAKVRSLRITLLLILTYVITWLPYNLLSWWIVLNFESYKQNIDANYILNSLVILNSVINPFIYGRCQGLRLLFKCREKLATPKKSKKMLNLLRN